MGFLMYFVYVLQSIKDNSYYIGYTSDIQKRLWEHNFGRTGYTSLKRPWKLIYKEEYKTMKEAVRRERHLKKIKNINYLKNLLGLGL
jgi:putative endonuclease